MSQVTSGWAPLVMRVQPEQVPQPSLGFSGQVSAWASPTAAS